MSDSRIDLTLEAELIDVLDRAEDRSNNVDAQRNRLLKP